MLGGGAQGGPQKPGEILQPREQVVLLLFDRAELHVVGQRLRVLDDGRALAGPRHHDRGRAVDVGVVGPFPRRLERVQRTPAPATMAVRDDARLGRVADRGKARAIGVIVAMSAHIVEEQPLVGRSGGRVAAAGRIPRRLRGAVVRKHLVESDWCLRGGGHGRCQQQNGSHESRLHGASCFAHKWKAATQRLPRRKLSREKRARFKRRRRRSKV